MLVAPGRRSLDILRVSTPAIYGDNQSANLGSKDWALTDLQHINHARFVEVVHRFFKQCSKFGQRGSSPESANISLCWEVLVVCLGGNHLKNPWKQRDHQSLAFVAEYMVLGDAVWYMSNGSMLTLQVLLSVSLKRLNF
jgi:hypothetical protein